MCEKKKKEKNVPRNFPKRHLGTERVAMAEAPGAAGIRTAEQIETRGHPPPPPAHPGDGAPQLQTTASGKRENGRRPHSRVPGGANGAMGGRRGGETSVGEGAGGGWLEPAGREAGTTGA